MGVFSLLGNLLNQHQRAAPPLSPGVQPADLLELTGVDHINTYVGTHWDIFFNQKTVSATQKVSMGRQGCCWQEIMFCGGELEQSTLLQLPQIFSFQLSSAWKGTFPKRPLFFPVHGACGWALTENNVDLAQALWELGRAPREHSPEERMGPKPKERHCLL